MFKKKGCPSCGKKIGKNSNFCSYCGVSFKEDRHRENYGMLGKNDAADLMQGVKLPFGFNKIFQSLVKQLERQMQSGNFEQGEIPKGFKIKVTTARPKTREMIGSQPTKVESVMEEIPIQEQNRRSCLPSVEAESSLKRLADRIIYEIEAPGVKHKGDVEMKQLESGMEIRAYSKDKCYVKSIPFSAEVIETLVKSGKVFLELKA